MQNESLNIINELQKIYNDVSEWLKFLEAKHATVFAVWTALFIAVVTSDTFQLFDVFYRAIIICIILLGIGINAISFVPLLNRSLLMRKICYKKYSKVDMSNIVFYQSIFVNTYVASKDLQERVNKYKVMLCERFDCTLKELGDTYMKDYMEQIIEVSTVATIKLYFFQISSKYVATVLLLLMLVCIIA